MHVLNLRVYHLKWIWVVCQAYDANEKCIKTQHVKTEEKNSMNIMKRSSLIAGFLPHALDVAISQTKSFKCANWDVAVAVAIINHRKKNRLKTHVICFWHYHKSTAHGTKTISGSHQQQDIQSKCSTKSKFRRNTNRFNCWNQFAFILE